MTTFLRIWNDFISFPNFPMHPLLNTFRREFLQQIVFERKKYFLITSENLYFPKSAQKIFRPRATNPYYPLNKFILKIFLHMSLIAVHESWTKEWDLNPRTFSKRALTTINLATMLSVLPGKSRIQIFNKNREAIWSIQLKILLDKSFMAPSFSIVSQPSFRGKS